MLKDVEGEEKQLELGCNKGKFLYQSQYLIATLILSKKIVITQNT